MAIEFEITRNGVTLRAQVDCPPRGQRALTWEGTQEEKDELGEILDGILQRWPHVWRAVDVNVRTLLRDYGRDDYLSTDEFELSMTGGAWCKADWGIEVLSKNGDGWWVVFFRDFEVVHAQPSF